MKSLLASLLLPLGACAGGGGEPPTVQGQIGLEAFESCGDLEQYIEDTAVRIMRNQLTGEHLYWADSAPRTADASAAPTAAAGGASGPTAYTKTNTQVAGVDEADFVKTNGTHIFVLSQESLFITRSWPASEMARIASLRIEGYGRDMFLDEERARIVVLSTVNAPYAAAAVSIDCLAYRSCGEWAPATKVTVVDVANPASPRVAGEVYLPGYQQNARRIGGSVRIVLGDSFRWPENMRWWPEVSPWHMLGESALKSAREDLADDNEVLIRARSLADWLPNGLRRLPDGSLVNLAYDCRDFHRTNASVWLGFTTIATIDLDHLDREVERTSIVAHTNEMYASQGSIYLSTRHWWWWPTPGSSDWTYLFKFDISRPEGATYLAAGGVAGSIVDQFSMDEHNGHLRVATTIANWVEDEQNPDNRWGRVETANRVSVLADRGGRLEVVGATPDLAPGERTQSSRFIGDRGFIVTFRQVDPLYTIDLSNPSNPRVVGELKIPGFSSYIHPLDANHLITIGTHLPDPGAAGPVDWRQRQMKLSIFDVSDFARPREKFTALIGTAHGWSEAAWEHKAFNYFPERGLLAIPFSDYLPDTWPGISIRRGLNRSDRCDPIGV